MPSLFLACLTPLLALLLATAPPAAHAWLDTQANVDDHSINAPTALSARPTMLNWPPPDSPIWT